MLEQAHPSFVDVRILEGVRNPLAPFLSREGDKNPHCSAFTQSVQLDQVAPEVYRALSCICTIHVSDRIAVSRTENTLGLLTVIVIICAGGTVESIQLYCASPSKDVACVDSHVLDLMYVCLRGQPKVHSKALLTQTFVATTSGVPGETDINEHRIAPSKSDCSLRVHGGRKIMNDFVYYDLRTHANENDPCRYHCLQWRLAR